MADTGEFVSPAEMIAMERAGTGRIEYDEFGNLLWIPFSSLGSKEAVRRLLDDPSLTIDEAPPAPGKAIQPNPQGLQQGFNPYDTGVLVKDGYRKNKDLRRLSHWIVRNRKPTGRG